MKFAVITPPNLLAYSTLANTGYHLCLAQAAERHPEYRDFYRRRRELGDHVILDNGAAEGTSMRAADLFQLARSLQPDEVVAPDVLGDAQNTLDATEAFIVGYGKLLQIYDINIMVVPQGRTLVEWLWCFQEMVHTIEFDPHWENVTTFGIPKNLDDNPSTDRGDVLHILDMVGPELTDRFGFHLLGICSGITPMQHLANFANFYPWIRGMDSILPVQAGIAGQLIGANSTRKSLRYPTHRVDPLEPYLQTISMLGNRCAKTNIKRVIELCEGRIPDDGLSSRRELF